MAANKLMDSKNQQAIFHEAVKQFAKAVGCDASNEGGKEFARIMLPAISEAAYYGGDILHKVATKLLTFRPQKSKEKGVPRD